jgi:hypothetical protein
VWGKVQDITEAGGCSVKEFQTPAAEVPVIKDMKAMATPKGIRRMKISFNNLLDLMIHRFVPKYKGFISAIAPRLVYARLTLCH